MADTVAQPMSVFDSEDDSVNHGLSPEYAFALLGNEVRMSIVHELAKAESPIGFKDLWHRVGIRDSGRFNYHLGELDGHFVRKTDEGYVLLEAGRNVVHAVYSGVLTKYPERRRERIDQPCPLCDEPIELEVTHRGLDRFCTACDGVYGSRIIEGEQTSAERGFSGTLALPPAAFEKRTISNAYRTAQIMLNLRMMHRARDICHHCAAPLEHEVEICEDHDMEPGGICDSCGVLCGPYQISVQSRCVNCTVRMGGDLGFMLYGQSSWMAYLLEHGINPVTATAAERPPWSHEVIAREPFEGAFRWHGSNDTLKITVDHHLEVIDVTRESH